MEQEAVGGRRRWYEGIVAGNKVWMFELLGTDQKDYYTKILDPLLYSRKILHSIEYSKESFYQDFVVAAISRFILQYSGCLSRAARGAAPRMPEQSNDYRVVVFGAGGVGKSSLVLRFVKGTFRDTYIPTVEDTYRQVISCDKSVCTLQITDTTGSHQFPAMQRLSISKGHAFILVYSITSRQSLEELKPIYQQILAIKSSVESIPIMLVGNKSDEMAQREVEPKEGEAQATTWKCAFMETSAKTNTNVKELFQELLALEKKRDMSLSIDGKRSGKQKQADKLKGKCSVM
ncbi:GTP-binding protein Di-Ras1a isoform X1 [Channa argus]